MPTTRFAPWSRSLAALTLTVVLSGCSVITGPDGEWGRAQSDLTRARRDWSANFIRDYEYVVRRDCYCLLGGVAVRVTVLNGFVVAREIDGTSTPIPISMEWLYPSIDGLFAVIQSAIDRRADEIDARYDFTYGFPSDFWIDYDYRTADDEEGYTLLRFRALR